MDKKPHEFKDSSGRSAYRARPRLRLIQGKHVREEPIEPARAALKAHPNNTHQGCWDDDHTPGPAAA